MLPAGMEAINTPRDMAAPRAARAEAGVELATAVGMLREMGRAYWLPEAELALTDAAASPEQLG